MVKAIKLQRVNNLMFVIYDDGTREIAKPSGSSLWFVGGGSTPPPTGAFKWPFPKALYTTYAGHSGLDFPGNSVGNSADIKSIGDGVVIEEYDYAFNTASSAEPNWRGICVVIDHGTINGERICSLYAHMSSRIVGIGDTVVGGQKIGVIGNTGRSDGTHLHWEIDINNVRRPTGAVPSGGDVTLAWMNANTDGSNW